MIPTVSASSSRRNLIPLGAVLGVISLLSSNWYIGGKYVVVDGGLVGIFAMLDLVFAVGFAVIALVKRTHGTVGMAWWLTIVLAGFLLWLGFYPPEEFARTALGPPFAIGLAAVTMLLVGISQIEIKDSEDERQSTDS